MRGRREELRRRSEQPDDEVFRIRLFQETGGAVLGGLDPALAEQLVRQQMIGQTMTYAAAHPGARYEILEHDGMPVGRLVIDETSGSIEVVDLALLSEKRGLGLGTRLLRTLVQAAEDSDRVLRLSVDPGNVGARKLYARMGLCVVAENATSLTMERKPRSR